jgi:hypothetical protein
MWATLGIAVRVGYAKLGRSILLDPGKWGPVGGDNEPYALLHSLATRHPSVSWEIIGRNSQEDPSSVGLPSNVVNPWAGAPRPKSYEETQAMGVPLFTGLDGVVIWLGQHGTSNNPIRKVGAQEGDVTEPQEAFLNYCSFLVNGMNAWVDADESREVTWLIADVRNYLKARDVKWPPRHSIIGQYAWSREQRHERYGDERTPQACGYTHGFWDQGVWVTRQSYSYDRLEIVGIPPSWSPQWDHADRVDFGILINEARAYVKLNRRDIMRDWVMPLHPSFVAGKWTDASAQKLGLNVQPIAHDRIPSVLGRARSTLTTPSSGSGWATTKPWECFALDVVCFFHPAYDTQGHVIPVRGKDGRWTGNHANDPEVCHLAEWLRPQTSSQFHKRVLAVASSRETFEWLVGVQRRLWQDARDQQMAVRTIGRRLGLE